MTKEKSTNKPRTILLPKEVWDKIEDDMEANKRGLSAQIEYMAEKFFEGKQNGQA